MELKSTLPKPYTNIQKADFIVLNNHQLGYEIRETATELQAWGADNAELLNQAKQAKLAELKSIRDAKEEEPVITDKGAFDFDNIARERIALASNVLGEGDNIVWTLADNTTAICTKTDLQAVISDGVARSDGLHSKYRMLKEAVNACTTIDEVNAISWGE